MCELVKIYENERGWQYKVMGGIGGNTYKARYKKPDIGGWHGVKALGWCDNFDDAQNQLNEYAHKKGMKAIDVLAGGDNNERN